MNRRDVVRQVIDLADDLSAIAAPASVTHPLAELCRAARLTFGAAAVSVSRRSGSDLVYEAADGAGASEIVGRRLPIDRGVAGYVVQAGQAISVDQVRNDPRFARDVAESTGYVPTSLLAVPITTLDDVVGVLSVLDRSSDGGPRDVLQVASAFAAVAAPLLGLADRLDRFGPVLLRAVAETSGDGSLAEALERIVARTPADEPTQIAMQLARARELSPAAGDTAARMLEEFVSFAARRRRR